MTKPLPLPDPPLGVGLTSVVLGAVGLLLFILPILGIPLGGVGLLFGLAGLLMAVFGRWSSLRWSIAGIAVSGLALAVSTAIAMAPVGYVPTGAAPSARQTGADRPYVSPPARPGSWLANSQRSKMVGTGAVGASGPLGPRILHQDNATAHEP